MQSNVFGAGIRSHKVWFFGENKIFLCLFPARRRVDDWPVRQSALSSLHGVFDGCPNMGVCGI